MKSLKESLFDNDLVTKKIYKYAPRTTRELNECIEAELKIQGENADLNCIDVSNIDDMLLLFFDFKRKIKNINISEWNVKNVKCMQSMFKGCTQFDCDLSKWDVSNVTNMTGMFEGCKKFNCDLSKWDVSSVTHMGWMFEGCESLDCDLSKWIPNKVEIAEGMFRGCKSLKIPSWYKNGCVIKR